MAWTFGCLWVYFLVWLYWLVFGVALGRFLEGSVFWVLWGLVIVFVLVFEFELRGLLFCMLCSGGFVDCVIL